MSKKIAFPLTQSEGPVANKASNDYETQGHLKTILDAHEIMNDPVKLKAAHKLAGRHKKAITSLEQLKQIHQDKYGGTMQHGQPQDGDADDGV